MASRLQIMLRDGGNKHLLQGWRERVKQNGLMLEKQGKGKQKGRKRWTKESENEKKEKRVRGGTNREGKGETGES